MATLRIKVATDQTRITLNVRRTIYHLFAASLVLSATVTATAQADRIDSRGREFWLGFMQNASGTQQLSLKISSATATTGSVSVPLAGWSTTFAVAANTVTTVVVPNIYESSGSEVVLNRGILVTSVDPVTVAALNYQNQTTDASQILPVGSLGTSYRVEALPGTSTAYSNGTYIFRSEFLVVATQDGTTVTITPTTTTTLGQAPNVPFTISLNAGQTYPVLALNGTTDLTGTLIEATAASGPCRPFAVFGGSMCAVVGCAACDHVNEQMAPVNTWGTNFHTIPFASSLVYGYRVQAGQDNTWVTIDGGAPFHLDAGQYHQVLNASQPVCITADRPISATQFMQGATCAGTGDPSLLVLEPDDRTSTSSVFTTFPSTQATINHFVNVLVPTGATGQVQIDGTPVAAALFGTYAACSGFSYAKVQVAQGTHRLSCPAGFVAYAYGLASGESYLYSIANDMAVPVPQDSVICSLAPVTLNTPITLTNAQWTTQSDPGTVLATGNSYTFTPDHNDVYRVDGELPVSGCPKHYEFNVGLPVDPQLNLVVNGAPTASVCQFSTVQLGVNTPLNPQSFNLHWSPGSQLSDPGILNPVATPSADTWYRLQVTSPVGCGSAVDSVHVTVLPSSIYAVRTSTTDDSICAGGSTGLHTQQEQVVRTDAFEGSLAPWWNQVLAGSLSNVCGSVTGNALYFNGAGIRSATTSAIDLSTGGMAHFALKIATGSAPCDDAEPGDDVVLEYSLNGTTWTLLATFNESAYPAMVEVDVHIPVLGPPGANARLRWRQLANSGAGHDNWCMDNVIITSYGDPSTPVWSSQGTLGQPSSAITSANPLISTWYTATVTTPSGCTYSDSVQIHVAPAFSVLPLSDTARCGGAGIRLQAVASESTGVHWSWAPNNGSLSSTTVSDPTATPMSTTQYTVVATNAIGCTDSRQVSVSVSGLSAVSASASDPTLCHGEQVGLSSVIASTAPYSVAWSPAATVVSPNMASTMAAPTDTTTFICTVTDTQSGCAMSASTTVNVNPAYTAHLQNDTTVCSALGMQLHLQHNVTAPFHIAWTPAANLNAANIAAPTILVDTSTTYTATVTDGNGCSVSRSVTITVAFDNLITPVNVSACQGQPLVLDAGFPGSTYDWTTNEGTQSITVTTPGSYTATITDTQACQAIRTFIAAFNPLPVVDLGPDLALCGLTDHVIDAGNAGSSVHWSTGATTHQLNVTATGTYSATVTTPQGCQSTDNVHVSLNPAPIDHLQDITACAAMPPTLDAGNPGCTYAWNTGGMAQTQPAQATGSYSVTVTTPQNCSSTFSAQVTLAPTVHVDLGPDTVLCTGQPLVLDAGVTGCTLAWSTGAVTPTIAATASGTYSVQATNGYCSNADTIHVTFNPLPTDQLADATTCSGMALTFDAGNAGSTYSWSNGIHDQAITVNAPGHYSVVVTGASGCNATFGADAIFVDPPSVDLGPDTVLCHGEVLTLDAGNPSDSFHWNTGSTAQHVEVSETGPYIVTVDNGHCTVSDSIRVLFNPVPQHLSTHQYFTCFDEEPHYVEIDAGNQGSFFHWGDGRSTAIIHAMTYGWQSVEITNAFGCAIRDSALVNEFCRPTLFIPNTFTPNGDGRNDVWLPVGNNIAQYDMYVFDRWGGVVFHSTSADAGWDGTLNGNPVPNDMYAWRLTYRLQEKSDGTLGAEQTKLGQVQVLR